jgi:protein O-GlcNAc transferase
VRSIPPDDATAISEFRIQGRLHDALRIVLQTPSVDPRVAAEAFNLGLQFERGGQLREAHSCYANSAKIAPHFIAARMNLGALSLRLGDSQGAAVQFEYVASRKPDSAEAWIGLAQAMLNSGRARQALAAIERIHGDFADSAQCWAWRGSAHAQIGDDVSALAAYDEALQRDARCFDALVGKALLLERDRRWSEAAAIYRIANGINPASNRVLGNLVYCLRSMNDWPGLERPEAALCARLRDVVGDYATQWLGLPLSASIYRKIAAAYAQRESAIRIGTTQAAAFVDRRPGRIRIGYVSSDFRNHATSLLMARVLERHDRDTFEIFAYSTGVNDKSVMRNRVEAASEHFLDVRGWAAPRLAQRLRDDAIDIWIDLNGHTKGACYGLAALRPAPIGVNYLGYPGTLGAFADYIIGDAYVTPHGSAEEFSECIVRLPHSYQPNDESRTVGPATTRAEHGLPADAWVACSFNLAWKLTPSLWACWMRAMKAQPRMVLWLLDNNTWSTANLIEAARSSNVDPSRIVFAPTLPQAEHMARIALADLALDTSPCNSHTTGSDALWMGVPMLTLRGNSFDARVGASLLAAAGLHEFIASSLDEYERKLMDFVSSPSRLAEIKTDWNARRSTSALFDSAAYTLALESAYRRMHERQISDLDPQEFDVESLGRLC